MPAERIDSLAAVLAAIRGTAGTTQPLLTQRVGLGKLTPIEPEPEPAPSLALADVSGDGHEPPPAME